MRVLIAAALLIAASGPALAADGRLLAQACLGCHGPDNAGASSTPGIAGRPAAELVAQMNAFRANERPGTIMGRIARGYSDAEIAAVAAHLATEARR
ncbi:MAG: c-type cytochrome [Acetobacteraceae bacterium]|nr:c-type cytochrome [Acetobacteraceae bacterium]